MHPCDVSVIIPFNDDEEILGTAITRVATYLRTQELAFEILAVDDDSRDNSQALLALIRPAFLELKVLYAEEPRSGFAIGSQRARGRVLWLIEPAQAARAPLGSFRDAYDAVVSGHRTLVIADTRFAVAHRARCLPALQGIVGLGTEFQYRLLRRVEHAAGKSTPRFGRLAGIGARFASPLAALMSGMRGASSEV